MCISNLNLVHECRDRNQHKTVDRLFMEVNSGKDNCLAVREKSAVEGRETVMEKGRARDTK